MGYRSINNLYKPSATKAFALLTECYALEKIHGTSAHFRWDKDNGFKYFPGGIKEESFMSMMEERFPTIERDVFKAFATMNAQWKEVVFYGEAYGGKCQKMSDVYGPLNFVVFEVKMNGEILTVPQAKVCCMSVSLPFVSFERGPATIEWVNSQRDKFSVQASRNGMGDDKIGEGIVIRSINERIKDRFGKSIVLKHKRAEFRETKTPREIDPERQKRWKAAQEVAEEFVVEQRLLHVIDKLVADKPGFEFSMKNTRTVIDAMIADVRKEENDSIEWSNDIQHAIGNRTANLWKLHLQNRLEELNGSDS